MKRLISVFYIMTASSVLASPTSKIDAGSAFEDYRFYNVSEFKVSNGFECSSYYGNTNMKIIADSISQNNLEITVINHSKGSVRDSYKSSCSLVDTNILNDDGQYQDEYTCLDGDLSLFVPLYKGVPETTVWDGSTGVVELSYIFEASLDRTWPWSNVDFRCKQTARYESYELR